MRGLRISVHALRDRCSCIPARIHAAVIDSIVWSDNTRNTVQQGQLAEWFERTTDAQRVVQVELPSTPTE